MPATARPSILRKVFEDHLSLLAGELDAFFEAEVASREAESRHNARSELAETLNQALRRLSYAETFEQMSGVLADSSAGFCSSIGVFSLAGDRLRGERARLKSPHAEERFRDLEFDAAQSAAIVGAIETGDPVVAMSTPREISPELFEIFAHEADEKAYILPIMVGDQPAGVIYASGFAEMAPLELLAQMASLCLIVRRRPEPARRLTLAPAHELVSIQADKPLVVPDRRIPDSWSELSPEDQELHLRAQRFARVQVAGMRLFSSEAVKEGRARKELYDALQSEIDSGRDIFRQTYLSATPTMVDYFHLELLRTLANDDLSLLGPGYPGPLI
jgi:hypothetical protein